MRARLAMVGTGQNDACPLCGLWNCDPSNCPPSSAAPAPVPATAGTRHAVLDLRGWFGVTLAPPSPVTSRNANRWVTTRSPGRPATRGRVTTARPHDGRFPNRS
ncbi:hypothetical protein ABZZ74_52610 [Streptomyces sp. NPDC006476]|uniref:hypothetical protein n=1 Tax=Streptomyces sp. NPDC006476 TaxID=3157175 RepID=UPI0033BBED6A